MRKLAEEGDSSKASREHKFGSHRSSSSWRHRSLPIEEGFARRSYEEYVADPVSALIYTSLHLQDLVEEEKVKCEVLVKEMRDERDAEKVAKETARNDLSGVRNQLKVSNDMLTTLRGDIKSLEKLRDNLANEKEQEKNKVSNLEEEVNGLKQKEESLSSEVQRLKQKVTELEDSLKNAPTAGASSSYPSGGIAELENLLKAKYMQLAQSAEKVKKTAQYAL